MMEENMQLVGKFNLRALQISLTTESDLLPKIHPDRIEVYVEWHGNSTNGCTALVIDCKSKPVAQLLAKRIKRIHQRSRQLFKQVETTIRFEGEDEVVFVEAEATL